MQQNTRSLAVWQTTALYIAIYGVMAAVVLYPVLSVKIPALGDYLNHLARMHILADIDHSEALSRFYRVSWQPIPYLAMDAVFVVLNHVATIYTAGRIFVAVCVLLPVLSVALLHFAAHRRVSLAPMVAFLCCYNYLLSWGFLPYLFTLCLAVMVFAGWIGSVGWPRWPRAVLFCVLALGLYLGHLVAFGAYCLAVAGFEFARAWRAGLRTWRVVGADWLAAGLQAVPPIVLALSVNVERPFVGPVLTQYGSLNAKLIALESPIWFFGGRADLFSGLFALLVLLLGLLTGRLRLSPAVWPAALMVGVAAVCMPDMLFSVYGMDWRLPLPVVLLLIGATSTTERSGSVVGLGVLTVFLVLTAIRSASITPGLREADRQIAEVRQVVSAMPRGMRLLPVDNVGQSVLPYRVTMQAAMVAVIDRDAFVPTLFTGLGTVHLTPAYQASGSPSHPPLHVSDLFDGLGRADDSANDEGDGNGQRIYWLGWQSKFDYVLVRFIGSHPVPLPANLRLVATSPAASLYRIDNTFSP